MTEILIPYLAAIALTVVAFVPAFGSFVYYRRRGAECDALAASYPAACRMDNLQEQVKERGDELGGLNAQLAEARHLIIEKEQAERWLNENRQVLQRVEVERQYQERLRVELADLQHRADEESVRYRQLRQELDVVEFRCGRSKAEEQDLIDRVAENGRLLRQLTDQVDLLQVRKAALDAQVAEAVVTTEAVGRRIEDARRELDDLRDELKAKQARLDALHDELAKAAGLREEARGLIERVAEHRARESELSARIASLEAEETRLATQVGVLGQRLATSRVQVEEAEVALEELRGNLRDEQAGLNETRREHARISAELTGMGQLREELGKTIEQIRERLNDVRVTAGEDDQHRLSELWQPVLSEEPSAQDQHDDEMKCLDQAQACLEEHGLRFDDRVLRAFHTSLKVADVSPLVVLAGISGTGKSELPRRYAEAMGIQFLNIAVQPRWDSPQDMFGFYNYLEGRYRATELSRALLQMDPFPDEEGRGWVRPPGGDWRSLHDRMLIVLLDEMNLARVEYYFSEFLSRLETRRGINKTDPRDRRKAEIPLEVGLRSGSRASNDGDRSMPPGSRPTMQLYVDTNILFVGTMNEDETTQTLSDKVIDRANVLRFGRPARLARILGDRPRGPGPTSNGIPKRSLRFETWQSWVKSEDSLDDVVGDQVDGWIESLNGALSLIQRPFAHRTRLAIRTFVANYPGGGDEAVRHAMADQVEQKILPKFRGLDLHDSSVKQAVQSVIQLLDKELDDQALVKAMQETLRNKDQLFAWQGVDRQADA